tara:strand:- start:1610 stop:1987 length:378 start_codon:yes stop_codon:yes gene_type:complete
MKITKRQLKRIIKEERTKLLKEFGSMDKEIMNPLVQFAQDWSGLGDAVQSQIIDVVNGYIENRVEAVYEVNPNALDTAKRKLSRSLRMLTDDDGQEILEALEWAEGIFREGDEEVERDGRAAGDR